MPDGSRLLNARVLLQQGDRYSIALLEGPADQPHSLLANRAASCLLAPCPGDRVLIAFAPEPFILAVLERHGTSPSELLLDGDARIRAREGELELSGDEGLALKSKKTLSLLAGALSFKSGSVKLFSNTVDAVAKQARVSFDDLGVLAKACDMMADRIVQRAGRVYRFVDELDQLRARHFDYRAENSAQIKGENTVMTARQVVKIDGEQIHVG